MRIRCFLATSTGLIAATIAWLLVAALGGQPAVAQQPDSAITAQPFAILHSDIPRTNCVGDTILLTNSLQGTISATVWLASSSTNPASGWSLQGVTLDSLQRGVLDVPLRTPIPVTVRFCGVAPVGETLTDTLVVRWVSAGATQLLTVPLQATITPVWGAPADTAFPNPITVGSQELLTVLATNRTSRPITVTTAKLENPFGDQGFAIVAPSSQTTVGPRQSLPLQIRFIANSYSQSPVANTVIINERDTLTELRIGVQARTAQASQPPQLSDTILQFGAVARGDCKKDSVMIDGGNSMLEIDTAWIASNGNLR